MKHFQETIINGEWEVADKYLSAFTNIDDNRYSKKLFFELQKQKYYEALHRNDHTWAECVFLEDLKLFSVFPNIFVGELAELSELKSLRENEQLSCYTNTTPQRAKFVEVLEVLVKRNCVLQEKLVFPSVNRSALFSLISLISPSFEKEERSINVNQFNFRLFIKEELIYLILQFLDEEEFKETLHNLEGESKIFFNVHCFGEHVVSEEWDNAEKYLSAFTKIDDIVYSAKIFSELGRHVHGHGKLPSENPAGDLLCNTLKLLLKKNPILENKLNFPSMGKSRLLKIIKMAMDWWTLHCESIKPNAKTNSLKGIPTVPYLSHAPSFGIDHSCQEGRFLPSIKW